MREKAYGRNLRWRHVSDYKRRGRCQAEGGTAKVRCIGNFTGKANFIVEGDVCPRKSSYCFTVFTFGPSSVDRLGAGFYIQEYSITKYFKVVNLTSSTTVELIGRH